MQSQLCNLQSVILQSQLYNSAIVQSYSRAIDLQSCNPAILQFAILNPTILQSYILQSYNPQSYNRNYIIWQSCSAYSRAVAIL